jgi:hypothetical protein
MAEPLARGGRMEDLAGRPESNAWLRDVVDRSPLLPDAALRRHWQRVIPWLPIAARYELAAILLEVEHGLQCD